MALRPKKQKKLWIWLAYSRARKRIIACEVGSRGVKTLKKLWKKLALFKPDVVCTDNYKVYSRVIPNNILVQSKRYTHNIEVQNSSLRDFGIRQRLVMGMEWIVYSNVCYTNLWRMYFIFFLYSD